MKLAALAILSALVAAPAAAQAAPPKLLVVVSVDQFSADLFAAYRRHFTGGFARLQEGAVFPSGYQSHAATETCPGHSTILTGARPARTGIVANDWIDLKAAREDKTIYCAEDESVPGSTSSKYTVSDKHLLVPTLGERMKAANPASRVVSVAGKDRAAVMMGGHRVDELWWWDGKAYASYAGRTAPPAVTSANAAIAARIATAQPALEVPAVCAPRDRAVAIGGGKTVGTGHFARAAGDARAFRASPEADGATLALAAALIRDMKLGQGPAPDIISIGASATDYVGHTYGPGGVETCLQLLSLDRDLGDFFAVLDRSGVDYAVALTADHGGLAATDDPSRHESYESILDGAGRDALVVDGTASDPVETERFEDPRLALRRRRPQCQGDRNRARHTARAEGPIAMGRQFRRRVDRSGSDEGAARPRAGRGDEGLCRAAPGAGGVQRRADRRDPDAHHPVRDLVAHRARTRIVPPGAIGRFHRRAAAKGHPDHRSDRRLCRHPRQLLGL